MSSEASGPPTHDPPTTMGFLWLLGHAMPSSVPGPWHSLFLLLRTLLPTSSHGNHLIPQISAQRSPSRKASLNAPVSVVTPTPCLYVSTLFVFFIALVTNLNHTFIRVLPHSLFLPVD